MKKTADDIKAVCQSAANINRQNLNKIITDNAETAFGKRYGFHEIHSVEDYIKKVPIAEYGNFRPYVEEMRSGKRNVLTSYPLEGFCITSGTEGERKYIPISKTALESYSDYIEWYKNRTYEKNGGKRLFLNGFRIAADQTLKNANLLSEIYYQSLFQTEKLSFDEYAGGETLLFNQTGVDVLYAKAWIGFCVSDITQIESIFLYDQLLFFKYIEENWQSLLKDIRAGCIPTDIDLPQSVRTYLCTVPVSEKRLQHVEEECRKGFESIAPRLWKRLTLASGISNPSFSVEDSVLRKYIGNITVHFFSYVASECHLGVSIWPENCSFVMLPESAFYEYLPYTENENALEAGHTLLPEEVKEGELYELILTNFSGLYRYRLGDVLRIDGFYGESPVIHFMFRKNQILNVAGEKMSVRQVEQAVMQCTATEGLEVQGYLVAELDGKIPARYGCVFSADKTSCYDREAVSIQLDEALKQENIDYKDIRDLGFLEKPEVLFLNNSEYKSFLQENNLMQGHHKPRHTAVIFKEELWRKWRGQTWREYT